MSTEIVMRSAKKSFFQETTVAIAVDYYPRDDPASLFFAQPWGAGIVWNLSQTVTFASDTDFTGNDRVSQTFHYRQVAAGVESVSSVSTTNQYCGKYSTLTLPAWNPNWGAVRSYEYLICGDVRTSVAITNQVNWPGVVNAYGKYYLPNLSVDMREKSPSAAPLWSVQEKWTKYACGNADIRPDGREWYVAQQTLKVCDAAYQQSGDYFAPPRTYDHGAWRLRDHPEIDFAIGYGGGRNEYYPPFGLPPYFTWDGGGGSLNLAFRVDAERNLLIQPPIVPSSVNLVHRELTYKLRTEVSDMYSTWRIKFSGSDQPPDVNANSMCVDSFNEYVVAAAFRAPVGDKKDLIVGVQRGLTKNRGTGQGSSAGWEWYKLATVDARSNLGLAFLPNGHLYLSYDEYSGATATPKYLISRKFGAGPVSNWETARTCDPAVSRILSAGRGQGMTWAVRTT